MRQVYDVAYDCGLEEITDGKLYIDNVLANYLESKDRDIAMVFQSYALYPNMSVYDNIGFGLQVRGLPKAEIRNASFAPPKYWIWVSISTASLRSFPADKCSVWLSGAR